MNLSAVALVQSLIAPVVMISACGLLCLALYNRLAAIVNRARIFNKERHDLQIKLSMLGEQAPEPVEVPEMRRRLGLLDAQAGQILMRGKMIRASLVALLATILCMLGCSMALGLSAIPVLADSAVWLALGFFVAGVASMAWSVWLAIKELGRALDPVAIEWREYDHESESAIP